jgi:hypothetical protein
VNLLTNGQRNPNDRSVIKFSSDGYPIRALQLNAEQEQYDLLGIATEIPTNSFPSSFISSKRPNYARDRTQIALAEEIDDTSSASVLFARSVLIVNTTSRLANRFNTNTQRAFLQIVGRQISI